ncbi:MAG: cell division protein FtsL [Deltaproteobacteria bacterium]|nr:cell division protein FtsL [Deltaproteobacteria bacterium]
MDHVFNRAYIHADILGQQIVKERVVPLKKGVKYQLAFITTLILCLLLFVWSRIEVVQIGYELSRWNKIYQERIQENQRLRVETSTLRSPSRIETIAKKELGLTNPKPEQIVILP